MPSSPPRRPSTLAAQKFADANRPLGSAPASRPVARAESTPMMGVGRSSVANAPAVPSRLVSSIPMRTRVAQATPYATTVRGAARPVVEAAPPPAREQPQAIARRAERERRDYLVVTSTVIVLLIGLIAFASMRVRTSMQVDKSRSAMNATFGRVFEQQGSFRILNRRFATWPELAARGARVGPQQRVVSSNASASHWFLAVRDTTTGIICSRTGELFDESPTERPATCRGLP
jgi:hypothetical protein